MLLWPARVFIWICPAMPVMTIMETLCVVAKFPMSFYVNVSKENQYAFVVSARHLDFFFNVFMIRSIVFVIYSF